MKNSKKFCDLTMVLQKKNQKPWNQEFVQNISKNASISWKVFKTCDNNQQILNKRAKANLRIRRFQCKNEDEMKKFRKMSSVFEFCLSKLSYMEIFMKIWKKMYFTIWLFDLDYLSDEDGEKVDAKNEGENERKWKNKFDLWISHFKIRLYGIFFENLRKKFLTHVLNIFWLIEAKLKIEIKKIWKISSVYEFSILKLGYMAIFLKICAKNFLTHFVGYFWLIKAIMKMKIKKHGKMCLIFDFSISKLVNVAV